MAKSEAETEVNSVDLMFWQWKEPTTIEKYVCRFCHSENRVFLIYEKLDGWTGGVWHPIVFFRGFQHVFQFKIVSKALDRDLDFV